MAGLVFPASAAPSLGEAAAGLEIRLFGPMEVRLGSQPLPRLRSRKGLWLLALLTLRAGREVERGWLAGTLWPDCDELHARRSLRQSLRDLRLALGPEAPRLASPSPRTLRLDVAAASVDVLAFDAAVVRGDRPEDTRSLEAAVQLYGGPLLEECGEEWILPERTSRERNYVAALERLAAAAAARGDPAAAAGYLRQAVGVDPYREDLARALMESLAQAGCPSGALLVYRQLDGMLRREMAAEPAAETTILFRHLRDETRARARTPMPASSWVPVGRAPPRSPARRPLPLPLTGLIGREAAVREVASRLAEARLVTLTGIGGIGKTRLALQVAEELRDQYVDGAWFVDLQALAEPALVPGAVAAALGVREGPARPLKESLVDALATRQLLLVLDNCEHLLETCPALAETLLCQCAGLRILATSRQALGARGETVWRVPSLAVPAEIVACWGLRVEGVGPSSSSDAPAPTPDRLDRFPSVQLFVERARAAEASFQLTTRNAAAVARVCRRLDGIPLAIELAAARVGAMPVTQIAERLDDRFHLLTGGIRTALPRQQTLRATMDWSYDLLSEPERGLLRRLSVFAGGWTLATAEAVCGDCGLRTADGGLSGPDSFRNPQSAIRNEEVLDLLTSLVEKSLVVYQEWEGEARYGLLETVRHYSAQRLLECGEGSAVRERHLDHFLGLAEEAEPHLTKTQRIEWLQRLEKEHDNLRAALDWSLAGCEPQGADCGVSGPAVPPSASPSPAVRVPPHAASGLRLAGALGCFWIVRGHLTEGRERLAQALASAAGATASQAMGAARAKALDAAGTLAALQADYRAARSLYEESLAVKRAFGDRLAIAHSLNHLGRVATEQGDYGVARSLFEESLAIRRESGDRLAIADSLNDLGTVAYTQGEHGAARSLYEESLAIRREFGDRLAIAQSLNHLGMVAREQGDYGAARSLHEESLAIRRESGDRLAIAHSLNHLGMVAREQGDYGAARSLHEESLAIRRKSGNRWGIAQSLNHLGMVAREQGDHGAACSLFKESLAIQHELGDRSGIAESLEALALLAGQRPGQPGEGEGGRGGERVPADEAAESAGAGRRAARLFGAAEALREAIAAPQRTNEQAAHCRQMTRTQEILQEAFAAAWAAGRAMLLEQAIAYALDEDAPGAEGGLQP